VQKSAQREYNEAKAERFLVNTRGRFSAKKLFKIFILKSKMEFERQHKQGEL